MKRIHKAMILALLGVFVFAVYNANAETKEPSGTISLEITSVGVGIGMEWGGGVLTYQGKEYPFKVKGLSVADVGASKITAKGEVYDLKELSDFNGNYVAAEAGLALAGGASGTIMKNQNGVIMRIQSTQQGVEISLAAEGISVELK